MKSIILIDENDNSMIIGECGVSKIDEKIKERVAISIEIMKRLNSYDLTVEEMNEALAICREINTENNKQWMSETNDWDDNDRDY